MPISTGIFYYTGKYKQQVVLSLSRYITSENRDSNASFIKHTGQPKPSLKPLVRDIISDYSTQDISSVLTRVLEQSNSYRRGIIIDCKHGSISSKTSYIYNSEIGINFNLKCYIS
jgi:hypothetical protein